MALAGYGWNESVSDCVTDLCFKAMGQFELDEVQKPIRLALLSRRY